VPVRLDDHLQVLESIPTQRSRIPEARFASF
jgi:hypothetical protein